MTQTIRNDQTRKTISRSTAEELVNAVQWSRAYASLPADSLTAREATHRSACTDLIAKAAVETPELLSACRDCADGWQ